MDSNLNLIEADAKENKLIELMVKVGKIENNISLQRYYFDLMELEKDPISLTEILFKLLTENFNNNKIINLRENDQKCFLIYFKNWTNKLINIDKAANIKNLSETIFKIMLIFFSNGINEKNKEIFEEIFKSLFILLKNNKEMNSDKMNIFIYKIFHDMRDEIANNENISLSRIKNILTLIESLANFHSELVKLTSDLIEYYNLMLFILDKFTNFIFIEIGLDLNKNKLSLLNHIVGTFCKISTKILTDTFKKEQLIKSLSFLNSENEIPPEMYECYLNNEKFLKFISKVMKMDITFIEGEEMSENIFILDYINKENMIYQINIAKSNIVDLMTNITELLIKSNILDQFENYKNFNNLLFVNILKALGEFYKVNYKGCNDKDILYIEKSDNTEDELVILKYITRIINFITVSTSLNESFISENKLDILRFVIMPVLRITPLERDIFLIDPEEFTKNVSDMSYKQNTNQPKIKTVKLIDILCEYIDSFPKFVTHFYIDIINYVISKNNPNFTAVYTILTEIKVVHEYLTTFSDEDLLDQSLQILSSISYIIYDKPKLQSFLEDRIDSINHVLIKIQDEYIKAKLCNFYAYSIEDMFQDHKQIISKSFDDAMHFMFSCLLSENKNISLNFIALDSIHSIIFIEDMKIVVTDIVKLYIKDVLSLIYSEHFKELTGNIIFHKFVKYLLSHYFKDIEASLIYIFAYFWKDVKIELETIIKGSRMETNQVLKEKNFKILENIHNIKSLLTTSIEQSQDLESKNKIYDELLIILNYIDKLVNYDYEEDILEIISLIINDLKLVPSIYINSLNVLLDKLIMNNKYKFEEYHINFIFNFLKNLRWEDSLRYKAKLYELISKRLLFIEKSTSVMKIINNHLNIANLLNVFIIFYWDNLDCLNNSEESIELNEYYPQSQHQPQLLNENFYFKILDLITKRLGIQPISDEYLVTKLCLNFYLIVIKLDSLSVNLLNQLKNFNNLEILLIKTITFQTIEDSCDENSVTAIFASKMIRFLFTEYFDVIKNYKDEFQDNSIMNFIKHLINFNIDQLLYLRKASIDVKEKNKFKEDIKIKKFNQEDEKSDENDLIEDIYSDLINEKKNITRKNKKCLIDQSYSDESEDSNSSASYLVSEDEKDLIDQIVNENDSDKDNDFLKVKKKPRNEFHNFIFNFGNNNFIKLLKTIDEFQLFNETLNYIAMRSMEIYLHLFSSFTKTKLNIVETIRKYKKIIPDTGAVNDNVINPKFRKIVKIKK